MDQRVLKAEGAKWYQIGLSLSSDGKTDEAIDAYTKATGFDPELADAHYNLGVGLAQTRRCEEALRAWRRAIWLDHGYMQQLIQAFDLEHELKESVLIPYPIDKQTRLAA